MKNVNHDSFRELYEARHEPENLRPIAEAYWRTLLVFAFVAVVLVILFGIWEFSSVISTVSSANTDGSSQQAPPIDKTQLENVLNKFADRRANYELVKDQGPAVTDPMK